MSPSLLRTNGSLSTKKTSIMCDINLVASLVVLFNRTFTYRFNTRLQGGGEEPIYLPADLSCDYHRIIFTRDYASSAQHEIAHWCLAGTERRQLQDYGYWYQPDGRALHQQKAFERVEAKPQALEWLFSQASGMTFNVSADNLNNGTEPSTSFKRSIAQQAQRYCEEGLSGRAQEWLMCLMEHFHTNKVLRPELYMVDAL